MRWLILIGWLVVLSPAHAQLEPIQFFGNGPGLGLDAPAYLTLSQNGKLGYLASSRARSGRLAVVDLSNGFDPLSIMVEAGKDAVGATIGGVGGPTALSVDEKFLYSLGTRKSLAVFRANPAGASLAVAQNLDFSKPADSIFDGFRGLVFGTGQRFLYITARDEIMVFQRNSEQGTLSLVQRLVDSGLDAAGNTVDFEGRFGIDLIPSEVSGNGHWLLTLSRRNDEILVWSINSQTGQLSLTHRYNEGENDAAGQPLLQLSFPGALAFSKSDNLLYVVASQGLSLFSMVPATGELTLVRHYEFNDNPLFFLDGHINIEASQNGRDLYITTLFEMVHFRVEPNSNLVTPKASLVDNDSRSNPFRAISFFDAATIADGSGLYLLDSRGDQLLKFLRDDATGDLLFDQSFSNNASLCPLPNGLDEPTATVLSPDGGRLYALASGSGALVSFQRNIVTNRLSSPRTYRFDNTFVQGGPESARVPLTLGISDSGEYLFTAAQFGELRAFRLDSSFNPQFQSRFVVEFSDIPGIVDMLVDDMNVFVKTEDQLIHVQFDPSTRSFSTVNTFAVNGHQLDKAGNTLVVSGFASGGRTSLLSWDLPVGFSLQQEITEDTLDADGMMHPTLRSVTDAALTPDGNRLVALSGFGDRLLVLTRNTNTGQFSVTHSIPLELGTKRSPIVFPNRALSISDDGSTAYIYRREGVGIDLAVNRLDLATLDLDQPVLVESRIIRVAGSTFAEINPAHIMSTRDGESAYLSLRGADGIQVIGTSDEIHFGDFETPAWQRSCIRP